MTATARAPRGRTRHRPRGHTDGPSPRPAPSCSPPRRSRSPSPGRRPAWTWARPTGGAGVALWLRADDAQALHDKLAAAGVRIVTAPADGPFGRQFAFADPEGYLITVHDLA